MLSTAKARVVAIKKNSNIKYVRVGNKRATHRLERNEKGKARKYPDQTDAVCEFVQERWDHGNTTTRLEVYEGLHIRDDCKEGTKFYDSYFAPSKDSSLAQF